MGKNKLAKFDDMAGYSNTLSPPYKKKGLI